MLLPIVYIIVSQCRGAFFSCYRACLGKLESFTGFLFSLWCGFPCLNTETIDALCMVYIIIWSPYYTLICRTQDWDLEWVVKWIGQSVPSILLLVINILKYLQSQNFLVRITFTKNYKWIIYWMWIQNFWVLMESINNKK